MKKAQLLVTLASGLVALVLLVPTSAQVGPGPVGPPIRVTPMLPTLVGGPIVGTTGTFSGALTTSSDLTARDVIAGAARFIYWTGRSLFSSPADGQLNINNNAASSGIGLDVTTDGKLIVRNRAQNAGGTVSALTFQTATALVALGVGGAPTFGTTGGTGPTTTAQNSWLLMTDSTGASFWVPVWK